MASSSFPRPGHNSGHVTNYENELLAKKATPDGVHGTPGDLSPAYADPTAVRTVRVQANTYATLRGSVYHSGSTDATLPQLAANTSGQPRIDAVVLRLDRSDWSISEHVITGIPSANPVAPALVRNSGSTGFYDLPLIDVRVNHGASNIDNSFVTRRCWYIGSDGQLRCTPTTRPPHETGRVAWDNTAGWIVSTGSRWIPAAEDTGDLTLPLASNWATPSYNTLRRVNGMVSLNISLQRKNTAIGVGVVTFGTLPAGFRPSRPFEGLGFAPSSGDCRINVTAAGSCQVLCYGGLNVDKFVNVHPIVFPADI